MSSNEERIRELILRGRKANLSAAVYEAESSLINDFWKTITSRDVDDALNRVESGIDGDDKCYSGKLLLAFFYWCSKNHVESFPSGESVAQFKMRFFDIMVSETCGSNLTDDGGLEVVELPRWQLPEFLRSLPKKTGRKKADHSERDLAIYTIYLAFKRENNRQNIPQLMADLIGINGLGVDNIKSRLKKIRKMSDFDEIEFIALQLLETVSVRPHDLLEYFRSCGALTAFR